MKITSKLSEALFHELSNINEPFYSILNSLANFIFLLAFPEKKEGKGRIKLYIIRLDAKEIGWASCIDEIIGYMMRAKKKKYIPVIQLSDSKNAIYDSNIGGNAWDYYFRQPFLDADNINNNYCKIYCNTKIKTVYKRYNPKQIHERSIILRDLKYNEKMCDYIRQNEVGMFGKSEIVGAYYRGTDYKKAPGWNPVGHSKVPDVYSFLDNLVSYCEEKSCKNVFIMTDEEEAFEYLTKQLEKDKVVRYINHPRFVKFKYGSTISTQTPDGLSRFENNRYYLLDIDILSKCTYLFGTMNSGMLLALNMNDNQYKDVNILNLGAN